MSTSIGGDRDDLLDSLVEPDTDTSAAMRAVLDSADATRSRRRAVLGSVAALIVLALVAAIVLTRPEDPTQVVAEGVTPSTVPETSIDPVPEAVPVEVAPETTAVVDSTAPVTAPPTTAAPVPTTVAPTTAPAPLPLEARTTVLTPKVRAGETASLEVGWAAGRVRGTPTIRIEWGDPAVTDDPAPAVPCDGAERPGIGKERANFRYATPGRHQVVVTVETCAPDGVSESVRLDATVEVTAAVIDGAPGTAVVAALPGTPGSDVGALDQAVARYAPAEPAAGAPASMLLGPRLPALSQRNAVGPATVLVVPLGARGLLELRWPDRRCTALAELDTTTSAADRPGSVELSIRC